MCTNKLFKTKTKFLVRMAEQMLTFIVVLVDFLFPSYSEYNFKDATSEKTLFLYYLKLKFSIFLKNLLLRTAYTLCITFPMLRLQLQHPALLP